jgi:Cu+-exporting ATPase
MDRRDFLRQVSVAGAGASVGACAGGSSSVAENRQVTYQVKGFTCVTCAVGLEVMLRDVKGVARAGASYPDNTVSIGFDDRLTNEEALKAFIADCGFTVA